MRVTSACRSAAFIASVSDDHRQSFTVDALTYAQKDRRKITIRNEFDAEFRQLFGRWDTTDSHTRIRTPVNILECVQETALYVDVVSEDVATMLWRTSSGYAHGRTWAWQATGRTREVTRDDGRVDTQGALDYQTVARMIAVVTVTIQYAVWLLNKRTGHPTYYNPVIDIQRPRQQRWRTNPTTPAPDDIDPR